MQSSNLLFTTKRLIIQSVELENLYHFLYFYQDSLTMQYIPNLPKSIDLQLLIKRFEPYMNQDTFPFGIYQIIHKESLQTIGEFSLFQVKLEPRQVELGYILHQSYWKQGLGSELLSAFMAYNHQYRLFDTLITNMFETNEASLALCKSLGFKEITRDDSIQPTPRVTLEWHNTKL